jgi:hypothetical protein
LRFSTKVAVNYALIFSAIGLMALVQKALHEYVSSDNSAAVEAGKEGLVMSYCLGVKEASRLAPGIEIGVGIVAVSLGVVGTFARSATIHKQANESNMASVASEDSAESFSA